MLPDWPGSGGWQTGRRSPEHPVLAGSRPPRYSVAAVLGPSTGVRVDLRRLVSVLDGLGDMTMSEFGMLRRRGMFASLMMLTRLGVVVGGLA